MNVALIKRNWFIGYRIAKVEFKDIDRLDSYGRKIIKELAEKLTNEYGKGFDRSNLYLHLQFYNEYPNIFGSIGQINDQKKELVEKEMLEINCDNQTDKLEFIKNSMIIEFLGLQNECTFTESELESNIISNIQKFLMELGKGYAFVARQQHIHTEKQDYYINLVFYNYLLKCFVLVDLKTNKITHQDVGQMDMYVRMRDELKRSEDDNPTMGIILCTDTDEDIAKYSILRGNEQLIATKYKLYLPTEDELRREIEHQKKLHMLHCGE